MKLALSGGGTEYDSVLIDRRFGEWLGAAGTLLYLPIALGWTSNEYAKTHRWIRSVLGQLGIKNIQMWTDLRHHTVSELERFDGIYIGGGNAYKLLYELRSYGFAEGIQQCARRGCPIYGGSAGAVVLGRNIATVAHLDSNENGITDLTGLDLADRFSVWVHYEESDTPRIQRFIDAQDSRLIVMSERAGVTIENNELSSVGPDPAYIVENGKWQSLEERSQSTGGHSP